MQFLLVVGIFFLTFTLFAVSLQFSKYKQRQASGCCGGGHCSTDAKPADRGHAGDHACCK